MAWMFLGMAIAAEVSATLALKASHGFSNLWPSLIVIVGYAAAFVLLSHALKTIGVGTAYATWSGIGTIGAGLGGMVFFGERPGVLTIAGVLLILVGVSAINLAGSTHTG